VDSLFPISDEGHAGIPCCLPLPHGHSERFEQKNLCQGRVTEVVVLTLNLQDSEPARKLLGRGLQYA